MFRLKKPYYNYAATAPISRSTKRAMIRVAKENRDPLQTHLGEWIGRLEETRSLISELIHASPDEIAMMPSTSMALSVIAKSIRWRPGDKVLFLADEFRSNRYVWENSTETRVIDPHREITFLEQLEKANLEGVRLVTLSAISYVDGRLFPVKEIAKFCHKRGILLAIDASELLATKVASFEPQRGFLF